MGCACLLAQAVEEEVADFLGDPERRHQHEVLADLDAVDLHHHDVECEGDAGAELFALKKRLTKKAPDDVGA